ncbi:2-oxo-tetronate isomerase [Rhizobium sp. 768_B6_N1_8]|uniref:2-oxo-tetronate isomerase n=1 Tax=unclassified Rhizobium TaxID=2613769 RepID=UPI003F2693FF
MPKFAANLTMMYREYDFLDRFTAAATAGFEAVEYLFPYDYDAFQIADILDSENLRQALFNMPPGDWARGERGLAALPERRDEFKSAVQRSIEYARVIKAPKLHMMAGIADRSDTTSKSCYLYSLAYAADLAGQEDIEVVIEPINSRDMPGYFLNNFDFAADVIDEVGRKNVRLQFDIYHRQVMRGDVLTALRDMLPIIGHMQIASVPTRAEPGTGELDDFRIFSVIDELEYTGFVGCEYNPTGDTNASLTWLSRALTSQVRSSTEIRMRKSDVAVLHIETPTRGACDPQHQRQS